MVTAALVLALAAIPGLAATPGGWRKPTSAEADQEWRKDRRHRYLAVSADFDGDGRADRAEILVRPSGTMAAVVVVFADAAKKPIVAVEFETSWLDVMGIDVVPPGEYRTACGKGYWECAADEPERLKLSRPAVEFFKYQSASNYYVYDKKTGGFRMYSISD